MGKPIKSCVGERFGKMTGIKAVSNSHYLFRCDCGNEEVRRGVTIRNRKGGIAQCLECCKKVRSLNGKLRRVDGISADYPRLYDVHRQMLRRCYNPSCKDYPAYGKRGIKVCRDWKDKVHFVEWALTSGYQLGLTIERVNVNGNYSPENCTWIPNIMQYRNSRRTKLYFYKGRKHTLRELAVISGKPYLTFKSRVQYYGWTIKEAMTTPVFKGRNQFSK